MNKQIYIIFDKKSGYYFSEMYLHDNDEVAKRWFDGYLHYIIDSNPNSPMAMYPSDFELRAIGTFDFYDAITALYDSARPVCGAQSFLIGQQEV